MSGIQTRPWVSFESSVRQGTLIFVVTKLLAVVALVALRRGGVGVAFLARALFALGRPFLLTLARSFEIGIGIRIGGRLMGSLDIRLVVGRHSEDTRQL